MMLLPIRNHPATYRAAQFFAAAKASLPRWLGGVRGELSVQDTAMVQSILPTLDQQRLFFQMLPNDQRHALAVARTLKQAGHTEPALLQAALLHDVAKSIGQPIAHRVAIVLLEAFWPAALQKLSVWPPSVGNSQLPECNDNSPFSDSHIRRFSWWRRPFVVHAWHPQIGAGWATEAKCKPLAINLILRHQERLQIIATKEDQLLATLQWADNLN